MKRTLLFSSLIYALPACGDDGGQTEGTGDGSTGSDGSSTSDEPGSTGNVETSDGSSTEAGAETGTGDESSGESDTGEPIDPPDVQDHAGGEPRAIAFAGGYAYLGLGPRIAVWDLEAEGGPVEVGSSEPFVGLVSGIAIAGDRAYVTTREDLFGDLYIVDLADPVAPTVISSHVYTDAEYHDPTDVVVDGDVLYLSDSEQGLYSFDIAEPDQPVEIDALPAVSVADLQLHDGRIRYVATSFIGTPSVGTIEIADGEMTELGSAGLSAQGSEVAFSGDLALQTGLFGTFAYDLTDPTSPVQIFADENALGFGVEVSGTTGYVFGPTGVTLFDLGGETPTAGDTLLAPTVRTMVTGIGGARMVALTGKGRGLLFDLTVPTAPTHDATFDIPVGVDVTGLAFGDGLVFASDFYTGMRIFDADDFASVGRYDSESELPGYEDVTLAGDLAYLSDWGSGLDIVDVSDPSTPALVGHITTAGYPSSVAIAGDLAFIGESTNGGAVRVIDVSDPSQPDELGAIETSKVRDLAYRDGFVYVADESVFDVGGLRIIDVGDPELPDLAGHYQTCESALAVALLGDHAYLACASDERLHVVDITNPRAPAMVVIVDLGHTGISSVAAIGSRAYVGHASGIVELDIRNPGDPRTMHEYPTAMLVRQLATRPDGAVYGAAGVGGVYRVQ